MIKINKEVARLFSAIGIIAFTGAFIGVVAVIARGVYFMSMKSELYFVGIVLLLVIQLYWLLGGRNV